MATRSNIGYVLPNGNVRHIYAHWDGYPQHNGKILFESYQAAYKIAQLIELGDVSSLASEIADCVFYGRDRRESGVEATECARDDMRQNDYAYLYDNGEWFVRGVGIPTWEPLADVLCAIEMDTKEIA